MPGARSQQQRSTVALRRWLQCAAGCLWGSGCLASALGAASQSPVAICSRPTSTTTVLSHLQFKCLINAAPYQLGPHMTDKLWHPLPQSASRGHRVERMGRLTGYIGEGGLGQGHDELACALAAAKVAAGNSQQL